MNAPSETHATTIVEDGLVEWLRAELDDPDIVAADNFLDVGGHSMTFARLNEHVGQRFGLSLDRKTTYSEALGDAARGAQPVT